MTGTDLARAARSFVRARARFTRVASDRDAAVLAAHEDGSSYAEIANVLGKHGCRITRAGVQRIVERGRTLSRMDLTVGATRTWDDS